MATFELMHPDRMKELKKMQLRQLSTLFLVLCTTALVGSGCSDQSSPPSPLMNTDSYDLPARKLDSIQKKTITPPAPKSCDKNYSGCVPIASDVDCAGGKGNGPAYARGPVEVIGYDIYDLDRDGDGVGCE